MNPTFKDPNNDLNSGRKRDYSCCFKSNVPRFYNEAGYEEVGPGSYDLCKNNEQIRHQ